MSEPIAIATQMAPAAVGPYSQAIVANGFLFCSGQIPLDPETGQKVTGGIEAQTRQVLANLSAVLQAGGCNWQQVVKTTVFLTDMADFPIVNAIYEKTLAPTRPARACVAVAALPKDAQVEIEAIAVMP